MRFLVTGAAGFIGFHVARRLLDEGHEVIGIDGFTPYYDVALKQHRHAMLERRRGYSGHRLTLEDTTAPGRLAALFPIDVVIHLAAQAGVRYSLANPRAYVDANLVGTFNLIETLRQQRVKHFLIASTSSVYGVSESVPFRETDCANHPLTLYAASKKSTEMMAHCYSHLWDIPTTILRFFTVYGPWSRPDMAPIRFADGIMQSKPIDIYNHGRMERDFTYIDDLVESVVRLSDCIPASPQLASGEPVRIPGDSLSPIAPCRIVNIGCGAPVNLLDFIAALESALGRKARRNYMEMQPGDVPRTFASADILFALTGYRPATPISEGVPRFAEWYRWYYRPERHEPL